MAAWRWRRRCGAAQLLLVITVTFLLLQCRLLWTQHVLAHQPLELPHDISSLPTLVPQISARCAYNTSAVSAGAVSAVLALVADDPAWTWIASTMRTLHPEWRRHLEPDMYGTRKLNVLVMPGMLIGTDFAGNVSILSGGPLGDLVQWAHLSLGLTLLGHTVTLTKQVYDVARLLRYGHTTGSVSMPRGCHSSTYDVIYTDIIALKALPNDVVEKSKCRWRILDAYGTDAGYNDPMYSRLHGLNSIYGGLALNLRQFYTFYPHSIDNSFLGFAVLPKFNVSVQKRNIGVLYGKDPNYFHGAHKYIQVLQQFMEIHSTVENSSSLPEGVVNHGVLSSAQYQDLLAMSKYFIGVGLPLESTGVMEAMSLGCIILNPCFTREQQTILQQQGKPTGRLLTSQVPYLETIGPPHVYTVNISDPRSVKQVIEQAQTLQVQSYIPREFTVKGFLHRIKRQLSHQNFCSEGLKKVWPPSRALLPTTGSQDQSCTVACSSRGLICEPAFFSLLQPQTSWPMNCTRKGGSVYYPAVSVSGRCVQQGHPLLYSCAGSHEQLKRLCPCRKYNLQYDV